MEEPRMAADLSQIGCEVHILDPATQEQFEVSFADGHGGGHMDGCVLGLPEAPKTWHVLEEKTHNARNFRKLQKEGVQQHKPVHWAQMQIYMRLTGMDRALYLAVNKDTDDLYAERVHLDKESADSYLKRASRIVHANKPPVGGGGSPDADECKYCHFVNLCHGNPAGVACPCVISCRSCVFAKPEPGGLWTCGVKEKTIGKFDQLRACEQHVFAPGLISFAEGVDAGRDEDGTVYAQYMNEEDNSVWCNGPSTKQGHYTSLELTKIPYQELCRGGSTVGLVKQEFKGEAVKGKPSGTGIPCYDEQNGIPF